uniref:His-Xaa-Ser system radical SAM maturase HxsC n=1 Tax=Candidatus Kentrum sp. LFY TaxID=2126342 RepID=A0A450WDK1_9GAMM|nr:MAG: His-Xaa-Ser system radical SAM maturase HxsC [Candidatus Kentron sp. LFY]
MDEPRGCKSNPIAESGVGMKLWTHGIPVDLNERSLGRVVFRPVSASERKDCIRVVPTEVSVNEDFRGYVAVLFGGKVDGLPRIGSPFLHSLGQLDFLAENHVILLSPENGFVRVLYRPESHSNAIFVTERCNSDCLMCSQPPKAINDEGLIEEHIRLIDLIQSAPEMLGITGGEPTLLKDRLIRLLQHIREKFPDTFIRMLSNGRMFAYEDMVQELAAIEHLNLITAIPLYSDNAPEHDYIVQAKGAFDQTLQGLYNMAKYGLGVEIRIVLHRLTLPRLIHLAEFIYRNLPFVRHVALMGLENMGYVKKNWELLWIDPIDYRRELENVIRFFHYRCLNVSIYNLPLCVLPENLWSFARQSISDFKNIYLDECQACRVRSHCTGLFQSSETRHSRGIHALQSVTNK